MAIYVSIEPRYAELRGGDRRNAALLPSDNITAIRTTKLVPSLAAGKFTAAYVDTLQAIETAIANPPHPATSASPNTAPNRVPADYTPLVLSVLGVAALGGGGYAALRWRKARRTQAEARWYCTQAKQYAGAVIVELGRALQADRNKAEYDQLSYGAADVELLAAAQREVASQFAQVQARFDDAGERLDQAAGSYKSMGGPTRSTPSSTRRSRRLRPRAQPRRPRGTAALPVAAGAAAVGAGAAPAALPVAAAGAAAAGAGAVTAAAAADGSRPQVAGFRSQVAGFRAACSL